MVAIVLESGKNARVTLRYLKGESKINIRHCEEEVTTTDEAIYRFDVNQDCLASFAMTTEIISSLILPF